MVSNTGRTVFVHYTGTLEDGSVFDSSRERDPYAFVVGEGTMIAGFEDAVTDMAVGETKTVVIEPDHAFGPHYPDEVQTLPLKTFEGQIPTAGQVIMLQSEDGQQVGATVLNVGMDGVEVDFNHPLAGKILTFEIEMIDVQDTASSDDAPSGEAEEDTID